MARFFVFIVVVGGLALVMNKTRPTQAEYLEELQRRADVIATQKDDAFHLMRGAHPLDEMVTAQPPARLFEQTQFEDYYVVSVFTTAYEVSGYGVRRVRTVGLFSKFIAYRPR